MFRNCVVLIVAWLLLPVYAETVTINIVAPNPTYECWIVGNFNGWKILNAVSCAKIDNTHFSVTLDDSTWVDSVNLSNMRYKFVKCPCDWSCVEKGKMGEEIRERMYRPCINDTIENWVNFPMAYRVPVKVKTPPGTEECYFVGDFNGWQVSDDLWKMEKYNVEENDSVVFITYFTVGLCQDETKYQFCCGPSIEYVQAEPADTFALSQTVFPTVKAWKKTYRTALSPPLADEIIITSKNQKIYIAGLNGYEEILVFDLDGRTSYWLSAKGKSELELLVNRGVYVIKLMDVCRKVLVE